VYRALHPELALRLVDRLSPHLGDDSPDESRLAAAAERQREWAAALLAREPEIGLLIMGHTHRPELSEPVPGRQYLNPGAWFEGYRYAVATDTGAELRVFSPATPLPPRPTAPR
jgi:UDP-2,3-diacylglucosamine pyrophosphatase LpxH